MRRLWSSRTFLPFLVLNIRPILFGALVGFTEWGIIGRPEWVGLANFEAAFADGRGWRMTCGG